MDYNCGRCHTILPLRHPDTTDGYRGLNFVLTTISGWHSEIFIWCSSRETQFSCGSMMDESSWHSGVKESKRIPWLYGLQIMRPGNSKGSVKICWNWEGDALILPSEEKQSSLMNPLPLLGSSLKYMRRGVFWAIGNCGIFLANFEVIIPLLMP